MPDTDGESGKRPRKKRRDAGRSRARSYQTHGLHAAKAVVAAERHLDARTTRGKALSEWRAAMVEDLGGAAELSTAEQTVLDQAARTLFLLDVIDEYVMASGRVVNRRKNAVYPVIEQRERLSAGLVKNLQALGLSRRARPALPLGQYLAAPATPDVAARPQRGGRGGGERRARGGQRARRRGPRGGPRPWGARWARRRGRARGPRHGPRPGRGGSRDGRPGRGPRPGGASGAAGRGGVRPRRLARAPYGGLRRGG